MALKRILRQLQKNNSRLESLRAAMCEKSEHGKVSLKSQPTQPIGADLLPSQAQSPPHLLRQNLATPTMME